LAVAIFGVADFRYDFSVGVPLVGTLHRYRVPTRGTPTKIVCSVSYLKSATLYILTNNKTSHTRHKRLVCNLGSIGQLSTVNYQLSTIYEALTICLGESVEVALDPRPIPGLNKD